MVICGKNRDLSLEKKENQQITILKLKQTEMKKSRQTQIRRQQQQLQTAATSRPSSSRSLLLPLYVTCR